MSEEVKVSVSDMKVLVIDNRVRLYKGQNQISYEECSSHEVALEVAEQLQKEHNATATAYGPLMSPEKLRMLEQRKARNKAEKIAKKEAGAEKVSKEEILKRQEENYRQLALLEGKTVEQLKQEMGIGV